MSKHSIKPWPRQAFYLSSELIESLTHEEVEATWFSLVELGLAKLPYPEFDLLIPLSNVLTFKGINDLGESWELPADKQAALVKVSNRVDPITKPITLRVEQYGATFLFHGKTPLKDRLDAVAGPDIDRDLEMDAVALEWLQVLVVLLATKNIVKETTHRKSVRLGIGGKEKHEYTTTLKVGTITEHTTSVDSGHSGITVRAHLRRGHIRRQHYGPLNEYVKKVWIAPTFVNADEQWIGERTAYNVSTSKARRQKEPAK